jgi:hypothetical protein
MEEAQFNFEAVSSAGDNAFYKVEWKNVVGM